MVQFCCVTGCGNRSNREKKQFYRLPNISKTCDRASYKADIILSRRKQWLLNIGRADLKDGDEAYSPGYIRVCSDHFVSGKPSVWADIENIDWAPTVKMGCGKDLGNSPWKKPQRNTAQKRAMRVQALQKRKGMLLGLVTDTKQGKVAEQKGGVKKVEDKSSQIQALKVKKGASSSQSDGTKQREAVKRKGKKNATKGKAKQIQELKVKRKSPGSNGPKQCKVPKKKTTSPKKRETVQSSLEIQRMLKKQELKVRRKILELELTGDTKNMPEEKFTVNPIIHRITMDCIVLSPEDDTEIKEEIPSTDSNIPESGCMPEVKEEDMN